QAQTLALDTPDQSLVPGTPDEGSDRVDEAQQGGQAKVLICHATHSVTNPYVLIEVAETAVETHRLHGDIVDPDGGVCPEAQVAPDTDQNLQDPAQANDQGQQAVVQQSSQNQVVIPNAQDASQSQQGTVQQGSQNQSVPNVQEENKAIFSRFLDEVANQGNIAAVDELFSPDVVAHQELLPDMPAGHDGVKQFFTALRSTFPDLHVTIEDQIAEGDRVVARETWRGTYRGGFQGIPSTGQQVAFTVIDIVCIADGKLVEQWATIDNLSLLQQLGVYSTAAPSGQ
ncbi:MAG: ester cyclase, partial [Chloroflexota bacterium]|nr:ester cyclase [Chloroflexota bacterium]